MKCAFCGGNTSRISKRGKSWVLQCTNCRHGFIDPMPTKAELESYYNKTRVERANLNALKKAVLAFEQSDSPKKDWYNQVLNIAEHATGKKKLRILEIGSAMGLFINHANKNGHEAIGTEVSKEYSALSNKLIEGRIVYIKQSYEKEINYRFDLIYLEHVLEHQTDADELLRQLKNLMEDSGIMVIRLPNHNSVQSRIFGSIWPWTVSKGHLQFFNPESLTELLNKHGLRVQMNTGDYFLRSIPQFWSLYTIANAMKYLSNRFLRTQFIPQMMGSRFPNTLSNIVLYLPFWILYPIVMMSGRFGMGSEIIAVARRGS